MIKVSEDIQNTLNPTSSQNNKTGLSRSIVLERGYLLVACLFAGGVTMVVELAGNRMITPIFGNTLFTWTGLISVVLVAIACGDYLGGVLVDWRPSFHLLGWLFVGAGIFAAGIPWEFRVLESWLSGLSLTWGPILATFLLFFVPACLLAAVSPVTIRLVSREMQDRRIGLSAGLVGMLATLGSFVGALGTGLYLVPRFSLTMIFLGTAGVLGILGLIALVVFQREGAMARAVIVTTLIPAAALWSIRSGEKDRAGLIWKQSTFYHDIRVIDRGLSNGNHVRLLHLDTTNEGAQIVETGELVFEYQKYWALVSVFCPDVSSALFIGGGGFGMPEQLALARPDADVTVVELDPAVLEAGRRFFRLNEFPQIRAVVEDGRRFLRQDKRRYDLIFGDAYSGVHSVPAHLATAEFFRDVKMRLTPRGIYMMNLISGFRGEQGALFRSVYSTLCEVFKDVWVFAVNDPYSKDVQNLILVASDASLDQLHTEAAGGELPLTMRGMLQKRILPDQMDAEGSVLLTDNYNPVEWIVAQQLQKRRAYAALSREQMPHLRQDASKRVKALRAED